MRKEYVYCAGSTAAAQYCADYLRSIGVPVSDDPGLHIRHLLLDVPSFNPDGRLRGGGNLDTLLASLAQDVLMYGGNLHHPLLDEYQTVDFLKDPMYVARNAAITADCALQIAMPLLPAVLHKLPVLIIGWGRIGKCLAKTMQALGCDVTVAARKETDRALLQALHYHAVDPACLEAQLPRFRLIYNTAPEMVLDDNLVNKCRNCVKIDLASYRGIAGEDVVWARGLPGAYAPESSGILIAETFIRFMKEG